MKRLTKRFIAMGLASAVLLSMTGCGSGDSGTTVGSDSTETGTQSAGADNSGTQGAAAENTGNSAKTDVPTITFYPRDANLTSGIVGGYKGEYFASRGFNVDVWAYSDEKTNAILASGDLPDVMFIPETSLDVMIESGMLLNLDEYLDKIPHLQSFEEGNAALNYVREFKSAGTGSVYGIPTSIGSNFAENKYVDATERNAVKLNWQVYEEIGAPEITDFDSLIDVMEQMQEAHPVDEDGNTFYGTVLNNGSDSNYWACMTMWYRFQGYLEDQLPYLLESNMIDGTYTSILSRDSLYYQGLKWYNKVYNRGLMDPDSINNDRATQKIKVDSGYTQIPSGYLPGWATTYLEYYIPGTKIYYNASSTYGDVRYMVGINSKTEKLDACLAFLDMLSDGDAYLNIMAGPEGEFWYADENGNAYFTEDGMDFLKANGGDMTGYVISNGETLEIWNTPFIVNNGVDTSYKDGNGGMRTAAVGGWTELNELSIDNGVFKAWQASTGQNTWKEWLESENAYFSTSPLDDVSSFTSLPDDTMQLTIDAIREKVTAASWQMVYSSTESEFEALWDQMVADCEGLDAQGIIEWRLNDLENAKTVRDSLK